MPIKKSLQSILSVLLTVCMIVAFSNCTNDTTSKSDDTVSVVESLDGSDAFAVSGEADTESENSADVSSENTSSAKADSSKTESSKESAKIIPNEKAAVPLKEKATAQGFQLKSVPKYGKSPYAVINDNTPYFTTADRTVKSFEKYSPLDKLGRCGVAYACVGKDLMPTEERGAIGQVKPSGWQLAKYDCVSGKYLYNRCHLIGYQLTAENANECNLITGTRYLNVDGMLPFENMVADYVKETKNHVLYRVTPIFEGNNLVAAGVLMEAYSVEDGGDDICFNVFCYNVQPGITINYADGTSKLNGAAATTSSQSSSSKVTSSTSSKVTSSKTSSTATSSKTASSTTSKTSSTTTTPSSNAKYIVNISKSSMKFHYPTCGSVSQMKESNKRATNESRESLISQGYSPCQKCNP
ncbi:MAG: DNA/RNA non-specific endonuclease [Clostridia bacterium]|nr:DNA/RNA non-specific endonuclease [Clostridia bacterium]